MTQPSFYPQVLQFAHEHPLPQDAHQMALSLLDVATLLCVCQRRESGTWVKMNLSLMFKNIADPHPGAFLSNPALLLNTERQSSYGISYGSHGAGCFFSYPYYQESSLAQAVLLSAFAPRTEVLGAPVHIYAKAALYLKEQGFLNKAELTLKHKDQLFDIEQVADEHYNTQWTYCSMSLSFDQAQVFALTRLQTELAFAATTLALQDPDSGTFNGATRAELTHLLKAFEADREARQLHEACLIGHAVTDLSADPSAHVSSTVKSSPRM